MIPWYVPDFSTPNRYQPDYAVTPGEVLAYELDLRKMSKAELAKRTGLTEQHLNAIVKCKGKSAITPETAIKLERAIGMPVDYWLNLEANYQETQARLAEEAQLERDLDWLRKLPLKEMIKLSWLSERSDGKAQLIEVLRFFGIASVDQWDDIWPRLAVAYRQHDKHEIRPEAVSAWLRQGELEAARIDCATYERAAFRHALNEARKLTAVANPAEFVPAVQAICAAAGVAVVFVPALPKQQHRRPPAPSPVQHRQQQHGHPARPRRRRHPRLQVRGQVSRRTFGNSSRSASSSLRSAWECLVDARVRRPAPVSAWASRSGARSLLPLESLI